jgi:hypothetical protein
MLTFIRVATMDSVTLQKVIDKISGDPPSATSSTSGATRRVTGNSNKNHGGFMASNANDTRVLSKNNVIDEDAPKSDEVRTIAGVANPDDGLPDGQDGQDGVARGDSTAAVAAYMTERKQRSVTIKQDEKMNFSPRASVSDVHVPF